MFEADITQLENQFIEICNKVNNNDDYLDNFEELLDSLYNIANEWVLVNDFLHSGLVHIINLHLFLKTLYEVVLTDLNGTQLVHEYDFSDDGMIQRGMKKLSSKLDILEISLTFKANAIIFNFLVLLSNFILFG